MGIGFAELAYTTHRCGVKKLEMGNQAMVFGAFAKSRKTTIGFVISACLLGPHGTTGLPLGGFSLNLIFEFYWKIWRDNSGFIKI